MKIQGAVIIEQGVTFAVVVVNRTVTNYTTRALRVRNQLSQFFRNMPIILMSQDSNGTPHYYGRRDIVEFLRSIRLDQIPWKEFCCTCGALRARAIPSSVCAKKASSPSDIFSTRTFTRTRSGNVGSTRHANSPKKSALIFSRTIIIACANF